MNIVKETAIGEENACALQRVSLDSHSHKLVINCWHGGIPIAVTKLGS